MKSIFTSLLACLFVSTIMAQATHTNPRCMRTPNPTYLKNHQMMPSIQKVQQATCETVTLHADGFASAPKYDDYFGEWACTVQAEGYTFHLDWYATANKTTGTWTTNDFEMYFSYATKPDGSTIDYKSITMTISKHVVSSKLSQRLLNATIQASDGNTYILNVEENILTPDQTIQHNIDDAQLTWKDSLLTIQASNADLQLQIVAHSDWPIGEYELANLDMNRCLATYKGVAQSIQQPTLSVNTKLQSNGLAAWDIHLGFYNQDTVFHQVSMTASIPEPNQVVVVDCKNLEVDDEYSAYFGTVYLYGSNAAYDIAVVYDGTKMQAGTYDDFMLFITDRATHQSIKTIYQSLKIVKDPQAGWVATVEALGIDNNWYSISMVYALPTVAKETVQIRFDNSAKASFWAEKYDLQFENENDAYKVAIDVVGVTVGQEFDIKKLDLNYTSIKAQGEYYPVEIATANGVIKQEGETTTIDVEIMGFDSILYDIEIWHSVPVPTDTVRLEMEMTFDNYLSDGFYTLKGMSADSSYQVAMTPYSKVVAGEFVNDGLFGKLGDVGGEYDFYFARTYVAVVRDWANEDYTLYTIEKGTMTVQMADDNSITAVAKVIASDGVYYEIHMTSQYREYLWDNPLKPVDRTFTHQDNVTIENYAQDYGFIEIYGISADGADMFDLYFYTHTSDPDIVIPAGTYPINRTGKDGTVRANPGISDGYVYPSFYATLNGDYLEDMYLFDSGTVEVSKDDQGQLRIEVQALDFYENTVHLVYGADATAVEDVTTTVNNARKVLKNNHIFLQKDGIEYTILGTVVQ